MGVILTAPHSTRRAQPVLVCVAVAVAVVVGWVLYRHYLYPDVVERIVRSPVVQRVWMFILVQAIFLCLPYALVLLLWGRDLTRGVTAAAIALATGLFLWGWTEVFDNYVDRDGRLTRTELSVFEWVSLLVVATLVPLAWGVARRSGRAWVAGLVVGPVVAAVLHEVELHWSWWQDRVTPAGTHHHWQLEAVVYVAPFVIAALACWAIDARRTSRK